MCVFCAIPLLCLVLAVLTARLKDSVDYPSARNALAVATLVNPIVGSLRTNTLGCSWISSKSPCLLTLREGTTTRSSMYALRKTWNMAAWSIYGNGVGCPGRPQLPPEHVDVVEKFLRVCGKTASTIDVVASQKSMHCTVLLFCWFS